MRYIYNVENLHCANCGAKIQDRLNRETYIKQAELNFMLKQITVEVEDKWDCSENELIALVQKIAHSIEFGVKVSAKDVKGRQENKNKVCVEDESICACNGHEHSHAHEDSHIDKHNKQGSKMNKAKFTKPKINTELVSMIIGFALFAIGFITNQDIIFIISYLLLGYDVIYKAFINLMKGHVLDENFLMTIATIAAFIIGEYPEAVAVMAFYKIGEYFQDRAVNHSQKQIEDAMDIRPEFARVVRDNGFSSVSPSQVKLGDVLEIRVGERIPLDGEVIEGRSMLDTSMLTGESLPVKAEQGDTILSGSINKESVLRIRVTATFEDSTVSKILELIKNASSKKSKSEKFITKFARVYTPIVVIIAVITAVVPSIIMGNWEQYIYLSILFLVISCPCALVVSIPLGFFAGIGKAAKLGILVKGGNYLERLNEIDTVVLDKTGTITKGEFGVDKVLCVKTLGDTEMDERKLLEIAAKLESKSNHPIARSITREYGSVEAMSGEYSEYSGEGVIVKTDDAIWLAGNDALMKRYNIQYKSNLDIGAIVHIAKDNTYLGCIVVTDKIKESSKMAITKLRQLGIKKAIMLTGDKKDNANIVAAEVGIDEIYSELLPKDKVEKLEEILNSGKVIFVGDGINDAPVLARADIGIAMGGAGSDAAIEAADIVLMTDDLMSLVGAMSVAKETRKIVRENIIFALGTKCIVIILGILGMANMWLAIFADVGVSLIAILNCMRILRKNIEN